MKVGDDLLFVYIAGPLTSSGRESVNVGAAVGYGFSLRQKFKNVVPIIPHFFWFLEFMVGRQEKNFWMSWDKDLLARCDLMIVLPGESSGVDEEIEFCEKHRIRWCNEASAEATIAQMQLLKNVPEGDDE